MCGVFGLMRLTWDWPVSATLGTIALVAGPVLGLLAGVVRQRSWHDAAAAVDLHYNLKDRATTALAFLTKSEATPLHELEIRDAQQHLTSIRAYEVVPVRMPRSLPIAALLLAGAITLIAWPTDRASVQAEPSGPLPEVLTEAESISEDLKELDELAERERDPELKELVHELQELLEEMVQPGVDLKEALATLSDMQAAISAQQAEYNLALVDGQLQSLGEEMMAAKPLQGAGTALQQSNYEQAAKNLEELDPADLEMTDCKGASEGMSKVAETMSASGLEEFSDAVAGMCEGMGSAGDKGKLSKGARNLANLLKTQASRQRISECLGAELTRLSECKGNCNKNSLTKGKIPSKSQSPNSGFSMTSSGNVHGEKTGLAANRNLQEITGSPGEGPSEMETVRSTEGREQAGRTYRDVYEKYQKESQAVLDSEPIPLGHRETIRRYFELIRPQKAEEEKGSGD
jgi:hypothetical protein